MIQALCEVVEGWTDPLPFTLQADGVAIDLTGLTVSIHLKDNQGTVVASGTSGITVTASTAGQVSYAAPSTSTFVAARTPYKIRFRVADATTTLFVYFPNVDEDLIKVNVL